jgi:hypothetical protein
MIDTLQSDPDVWAQLEIPRRNMPVAGEHMLAFFAFLEKDFRIFDFFSGAVDAFQHLAGSSLAFQFMNKVHHPVEVASPPFACMLAWRTTISETPAGAPARRAGEIPECAALLTRPFPDGQPVPDGSNFLALMDASAYMRNWSVQPKGLQDSELDVYLRTLSEQGYQFTDLTYRGRRATPRNVRLAVREKMQVLVERLGARQPHVVDQMEVETVGKALSNAFEYWAPGALVGLGATNASGVELQGAVKVPYTDYFRFHLNLRLSGFSRRNLDPVSRPGDYHWLYDLEAAAFLLRESPLWRGGIMQLEYGLGWGVLWRGTTLPVNRYIWRHGPQALLGLTLFQRVFLDVTASRFLDDCEYNNHCAQVSQEHQDHEIPIVPYKFHVLATLGLRLIFR